MSGLLEEKVMQRLDEIQEKIDINKRMVFFITMCDCTGWCYGDCQGDCGGDCNDAIQSHWG